MNHINMYYSGWEVELPTWDHHGGNYYMFDVADFCLKCLFSTKPQMGFVSPTITEPGTFHLPSKCVNYNSLIVQ